MKKWIAMLCVLALTALCCAPAFAEGMAADLMEVTRRAKEQLDIGDEYDDFNGNCYDGMWDLNWSGDNVYVNVRCDGEGCVYGYNRYEYDETVYNAAYSPRFPRVGREKLAALSDSFLARVLPDAEASWELVDVRSELSRYGSAQATVTQRMLWNGVPTDVELTVELDSQTGKVTGYYRSDSYRVYRKKDYATETAVTEDEARALLEGKRPLRLAYRVLDEGEPARLVYVPAEDGVWAVRAKDGELVDLQTEQLYLRDNATAEEAMAVGGKGLTEAELKGAGLYENALAAEELDAKIRAVAELGLTEDDVLNSVSYFADGERLIAYLEYQRPLTTEEKIERLGEDDGDVWYDSRSLNVDARTGEVRSMYTYRPGKDDEPQKNEASRETAEAFLAQYYPEYAENLAAQDTDEGNCFRFVRTYGGYPYDSNGVEVTVDAESGCILDLSINWDDTQEFTEAEGELIAPEEALKAALSRATLEKAYLSVPTSDNEYDPKYDLALCWHFDERDYLLGVDAMTGEAYFSESFGESRYEYSDVAGDENEIVINALGNYGVGFSGGEFCPEQTCTVRDLLVLALQAGGYADAEQSSYADLVSEARSMGATGLEERGEADAATRADFAQMLIELSGYGRAAAIEGIYACGFTDDAQVPEGRYGVVAIAYGLGLLKTDDDGSIRADEALTRSGAAAMLCELLSME